MAIKSQKSKAPQKVNKKATEKLEISLRKKIKDFVFSLGHDAEDIGDEIKKTSKVLAKRLTRKLGEAKKTIDEKVAKVKKAGKTATKKSDAKADKFVAKLKKEGKKLAREAASVKNVDVVATIKKEAKKAMTHKTTPASPAKNSIANAKPILKKKPIPKPVEKNKADAKVENEPTQENAHPETPTPKKRTTVASRIPKSDTKPQNTDLPLAAGPRNKYKRG